ncbi:hypothetical protein HN011_001103 [Eciton burchellii]|nr:hypothetical protein HN011_001103 [Eciton burchellii]
MPRLREAGDQSLAPLPHTHRAALAVPLLPGHLQQDRHSALAHTHQAQGDAVRREGVFVEDGDCPAEETAAATSATTASAPRAPGRALLRLRVTLTIPRAARLPGPQVVPRPRGGVRGSGTSGGSVDATVLSRLDQTREPREDSRILSKGIIKERFLESLSGYLGIQGFPRSAVVPPAGRNSGDVSVLPLPRAAKEAGPAIDNTMRCRLAGQVHMASLAIIICRFIRLSHLFGRVVVPLSGRREGERPSGLDGYRSSSKLPSRLANRRKDDATRRGSKIGQGIYRRAHALTVGRTMAPSQNFARTIERW